ncbi:MAG: glycerol-3-phosphate dehydrogenase/oxidase [Chloroflexi bacterium]|nr:MAG: glycerol-3-phosphate dehydrogenase/oxidase [Chloroflexota bacterium]
MQPLSSVVRMQNLSDLGSHHFDVLVIGGGVTGAGVALDAVARGYKVALVEKADFASGTSSKSTKLVHGGIRYLPSFDFALVQEGLVERGILLRNAPFLVHQVGFVLPIYRGDRHPVGLPFTTPGGVGIGLLLDAGLWTYDVMAGTQNGYHHRRLSRAQVMKLAPALKTEGLREGFMYYDGQTNDARLTITLLRTAAQHGATITNYTEVSSFLMDSGKVRAAYVRDTLNGQQILIHARHIVNATGVFAEQVETLTGIEAQVQIEPSKGVHLVLPREKLKLGDEVIVLPETEDKRILFIAPWQARAILGTTDTGAGDLDHPIADQQDIAYLLQYLNRYLAVQLTEDDIISVYAGYRPLLKSRSAHKSTAQLSRTHAVLQHPSGLVSIVGGKLTTYRRMAQDTVDVLSRRDEAAVTHPTQLMPLQGSAGWVVAKKALQERGSILGLSERSIEHLGRSYGTEANKLLDFIEKDASLGELLIADLPYVWAEVVYACRYEMAMTPYDVLARRTSIVLEDWQRGLGIVDEVAAMMAVEQQWSPAQQQAMVQAYRHAVQGELIMEAGYQERDENRSV